MTKKIIGIILIVGAVVLGYLGVNGLKKSSNSVEVLGVELSAEDKGGKEIAYVEIGAAVVALVGGIYLVSAKEK